MTRETTATLTGMSGVDWAARAQMSDSQSQSGVRRLIVQYVLLLAVLFAALQLIAVTNADGLRELMGWMVPLSILSVSAWTVYRLLSAYPPTVWTPMLWFIVACGVYFGFGPLVYTFGNEHSILQATAILPNDLFRTNNLNLVGMITVTVCFLISSIVVDTRFTRFPAGTGDSEAKAAAVGFLTVGLTVKYLLVLPHEYGLLTWTLPGSIYALENLVLVGIALLAYLATEDDNWGTCLLILFPIEFAQDFLRFNKTALLMLIVAVGLGRFLRTQRVSTLLRFAAVGAAVYVAIVPLVLAARGQLAQEVGPTFRLGASGRQKIAKDVLTGHSEAGSQGYRAQNWWLRFNYAGLQTYAMDAHDAGHGIETYSMAKYVLIPRILWPEKPIISDIGLDFNEIFFRNRTSRCSPGVFAEAYWNGGWSMCVLVCAYIGFLLSVLSRIALVCILEQQWLSLPAILIGMRIGSRIDTVLVGTFIGGAAMCLAYYAIAALYCQFSSSYESFLGARPLGASENVQATR